MDFLKPTFQVRFNLSRSLVERDGCDVVFFCFGYDIMDAIVVLYLNHALVFQINTM
jgi:hypothetical protein